MTHEARTAELKAMTAKALRPIAKDLGITGASRMTKDALINEIIGAESQEARVVAYEIRDELLADGFTEQAVADVPASKLTPKFKAGARFRIEPAEHTWSEVELIELDPEGGPGFAWRVQLVADAKNLDQIPENFHVITLNEDFLSNDYVTPVVAEQPKAEEIYVRVLPGGRREVVVIEEERAGNVWYRFVQKGLPRSAQYCLKAHRFAERYVRVPS